MTLHTINTGFFKLDGGAMFGVVPKVIWQKINPADENNLCTWAMRCLLIEDGNRLILIDTGLGDKQSEKFFSYFQPHGEDSLIKSIEAKGFSADDITDVIHTHLHFDHCGGSVNRVGDNLEAAFKNATYWNDETHWNWAMTPNAREKASFLKENFEPLQSNGQVKFIDPNNSPFENINFEMVYGHTEAMILPIINYNGKTLAYMADLIPSAGHIPLPYIMGYDLRALTTLNEKTAFLQKAIDNNYTLYFEHDPKIECCSIKMTEKGIRMDEAFSLSEFV